MWPSWVHRGRQVHAHEPDRLPRHAHLRRILAQRPEGLRPGRRRARRIRNKRSGSCFRPSTCCPRNGPAQRRAALIYAGHGARERRAQAVRALERVGSPTGWRTDRTSCRAGSASAWPSPGRSSMSLDPARGRAHRKPRFYDERRDHAGVRGAARQGQTIVMVTHEHDIAAHAARVVTLRDGLIATDQRQAA